MDSVLNAFKTSTAALIENSKEELKGIRTGRANAGMVENLMVEAYGSKMRLRELATIATEGPTAIVIVPFDPGTVKNIENAIIDSPLGFNPKTEGTKMYIRIPPLSEEQRVKYAKLANQMIEETKNYIRHAREDSRKKIKNMFDAKEIREDEKFRAEKEIDSITSNTTETLQSMKESKEKEIMEV